MKIAIVQGLLVSIGGSDKVVKATHAVFLQADIFTLVCNDGTLDELRFDKKMVTKSFVKRLARANKDYRKSLQFFPFAVQ